MAPRAYWKGYLKLSLVSCPIALYPASSSTERVSFNRINKKTGNRLKQLNVDSETGVPHLEVGGDVRLLQFDPGTVRPFSPDDAVTSMFAKSTSHAA